MEPLDLSGKNRNMGDDDRQQPIKEGPSRVEKLQQKLYAPDSHFENKPRKDLQQKPHLFKSKWDDGGDNQFAQELQKPGLSVFAKIAIGALVFFIVSLVIAYYSFLGNSEIATNKVDVKVISPVSVGGGEELTLDIIVENNDTAQMRTVDLVIEYPEGTKSATDLRTDVGRVRVGLGDINPGEIVKESYSAVLFGEEGDQKEIAVKVEYRLPGSTAIFEQEKTTTVALQSSPLRLFVDTVKEITANQELVFDVTLSSNSNQELKNVLVNVDYPFGFTVTDTTLRPSDDDDTWFFEELAPQEEITFEVRGRLSGQNREERVFKWNAGVADEANPNALGITFTSVPKAVTITQPFLALELAIDGDTNNEVVRANVGSEGLEGRLTYFNNTGGTINNAKITLQLDGEVLDDPTVEATYGFFNSIDNTITWDGDTLDQLRRIPAGDRETLIFRFQPKPLATRAAVFKNPEIVINANVSGRRTAEDEVPEDIQSSTVTRVKFASDVVLNAITSYFGEPFQNTGPLPPRVEQETTYTITLSLLNSSNNLENGRVVAVLPSYVRWNNVIEPANEELAFDPVTRRLEWNLRDVQEHAGYLTQPRVVSFQVTFVPSASQIGATPVLLGDPVFEAQDTFTNTEVTSVATEPTIDAGAETGLETTKVVE